MNWTTLLVSKLRCVNNRWKPTVTPSAVTAYPPKRSPKSTQLKPQPQRNTKAVTSPANGIVSAASVAIRAVTEMGGRAFVGTVSGVVTVIGSGWVKYDPCLEQAS